jgi:glycosyltransferase involved in cell wall biosynthesis
LELPVSLVSIIVPVLNEEEHLCQFFTSIDSQHYKNLEIIFIDDGSTDETINLISKEIEKRTNFFLFKNERNLGISVSCNFGISQSTGEFIAFLSAHDYIDPDFISKRHDALIVHPEAGLTFSNTMVREQGSVIKRLDNSIPFEKGAYISATQYSNLLKKRFFHIPSNTVLFRKSCISSGQPYLPKLGLYSDWYLVAKTLLNYGGVFVTGAQSTFLIHDGAYGNHQKYSAHSIETYTKSFLEELNSDFVTLERFKETALYPNFNILLLMKLFFDKKYRHYINLAVIKNVLSRFLWHSFYFDKLPAEHKKRVKDALLSKI